MVFIHGGGNAIGSAQAEVEPGRLLYDGAALAETTGNVVVTLQYRLGPLGWLVHPALDAEAPDSRSGNYALEDLIAALKWVQRDIAAFGGDKDRVMIFGESAGGLNVCALLASPAAAGLFTSALIESGGCVADARSAALTTGTTLADNVGCSTASDVPACLRSKTPAQLLAALPPVVSVAGSQPPYQPNVDGTLLPTAPLDAIRNGQHNRVPVVIGTNADETGREVPLTFSEEDYQAFLASTITNPDVRAQVVGPVFVRQLRFRTTRLRRADLGFQVHLPFPHDRARPHDCPDRAGVPVLLHRGPQRSHLEPLRRLPRPRVVVCVRRARRTRLHTNDRGTFARRRPCKGTGAPSRASGTPSAAGAPVWTQYDPGRDNHLVLDAAALAMGDGVNTSRCDFWATFGL